MKYISTRGGAPELGFRDVLMSGLAADGGLYMPALWPNFSPQSVREICASPLARAVAAVLAPFAGPEIGVDELERFGHDAFATFTDPATAPLRQITEDVWLLELFHGPTLAFKDVAMQMLGRLYDWALAGDTQKRTIIGATSGDTGGAAVAAFAGRPAVELFMLHPHGRISDVQRRIMTTTGAPNIHNIAVHGTFDDCQRLVKELFVDPALTKARRLTGVNSINWVRLIVQSAYYFTATGQFPDSAPPPVFVAPTGNFGDAFAGYAARRMGLPTGPIAVAVNQNDIMLRVLSEGVYRPGVVSKTSSPSMDIQVASNFERLMFEASKRDARWVRRAMTELDRDGEFRLPPEILVAMQSNFIAARASEHEVAEKIAAVHRRLGLLVDPHTAVGLVCLDQLRESGSARGPAIVLATADPAKFPEAVEAAAGVAPAAPAALAGISQGTEKMIQAEADLVSIRQIILDRG